ncbi:helix-turn-helix transcriptional regulator [Phreatobacter aquaticus]|uniref:Helix-turn-helix transcriptional regulator n=1 Tax=Phreatobacter aquaticus TaxID=2570229 RepID=A0A4D7QS13_9HYPH|nr:helix-turn-helix transcriptional regulator [Phreatobacter aquaticus]QCK88034.1 helix-turn-helix transcriptional regulator [Phreatobacter aquaticus]
MTILAEIKGFIGSVVRQAMSIQARAYATKESSERKANPNLKQPPEAGPSGWTVIFDTETGVDHAQALRIGAYEVRRNADLYERGAFYEPAALSEEELQRLKSYAADHGLVCRTTREFVTQIFYGIGYDLRAAIVGLNLPFDISRLAIDHGNARGPVMRGGFSFRLSEDPHLPRLQIRNLSRRAAMIQFTATRKRQDNRRERQAKKSPPVRRGYFIDIGTVGAALMSQTFSLDRLAKALGVESQKGDPGQHGATLTADYIAYAVQDVRVTWECYRALRVKFLGHNLDKSHMHRVLSEASLGKAYLKQMGIVPWRKLQPDFPNETLGVIMSTYYGGRTEVRLRRQIGQVLYCDFLSMYPTVCTLMNLWRFVIAKGIDWSDATEETRGFLETVTAADLQKQTTWRSLTTLVQVMPDDDILPVRAKYGDAQQATIGLNYLKGDKPLWYTLADCVASKLLIGKAPRVVRALRFKPKGKQTNLAPIAIAGSPDHLVDPRTDDFYRRVIDLRSKVKAARRNADLLTRYRLEFEQLALKILANATSYGIFVELNVEELDEPEDVRCHTGSGEAFDVQTANLEKPGTYFHPLLATLITGAARLMLALAEKRTIDAGLDWAFCDTDSMAITKPDAMEQDEFFRRAKSVCDWFVPLNPYEAKGPLFKIEDVNFAEGTESLEPLFCLAISSKRYVLFNLDSQGLPVIRKASAHGLGHLLPPYQNSVVLKGNADEAAILQSAEIEAWQYDLWFHIIQAMREGHPEQVRLDYHPALKQPAISRYGATTPALLKLFDHFNRGRSYRQKVKPFNFMIALYANALSWTSNLPKFPTTTGRGKGLKTPELGLRPVAPFARNPSDAASKAFDRITGGPVPASVLKTYRQVLAQYHLSPEMKFENGDFTESGVTRRRHVEFIEVVSIGKEANKLEEQMFMGADADAHIEYGVGAIGQNQRVAELRKLAAKIGRREVSEITGVSRGTIDRLLNSAELPIGPRTATKLAKGLEKLRSEAVSRDFKDRALRQMVVSRLEEIGLRPFAAELDFNPSNLRKVAIGHRDISVGLRTRLQAYFSRTGRSKAA